MVRKYSYYPAFDGKAAGEGTLKLVELCAKRWKCKSLGVYQVRLMRNDHTKNMKIGDAGYEKFLSVHSTGAAADIQYPSEAVAKEMWDWFIAHTEELGIEEIHWYAKGDYGWGYRCSRGANAKGIKQFTASDNAGSYQGSPNWLHVELSPEMAKDATKFEAAWRALPKPNQG